jgi:imidazolonepropionase-like amidohydrolase
LDRVAAHVAEYKAKGYDHIKLYNEHGAAFDSLAAAARREGLPIVGHVPTRETLERVLAAGVRSIEHLTGFDNAVRDRLLKVGIGSKVGMSSRDWQKPEHEALRQQASTVVADLIARANVWNCLTLALIKTQMGVPMYAKALHAAGANLLLCSDDDHPDGDRTILNELKALVEVAGLSPYEALLTGTRNVADFYGTLDEGGTIAGGKRADLVLLTGNPLADVGHVAHPAGVMIGGRWLSREASGPRLARMAAEHEVIMKRKIAEMLEEEEQRKKRAKKKASATEP